PVMEEYCDTKILNHEWFIKPFRPAHGLRDLWYVPKLRGFAAEGVVNASTVGVSRTLEERFREQAEKWDRETAHLSSPNQRFGHPSYQAILGMGRDNPREVVRLMLRDLQQNRRAWFWALSYLAKDNPVEPPDAGKTDKMIKAWVNWGKAERLL